jgi:predicted nucleic acid-binding protein
VNAAGPGLRSDAFVVDAGVAIKWYVPESDEAEAKRFLDPGFELHVPELFFPEFGSIVWKKSRVLKAPEMTTAEGLDTIRFLLGVTLTAHPMAPLLEAAYEIAAGPARPTVYDCCYLVLAEVLGCRLVTADRAFYNALKPSRHDPYLLWVADPI